MNDIKPTKLIRFKETIRRTSKSRAGIYAAINRGDFPKPVRLGPKSVAFVESEVDAWIADLMDRRGNTQVA